MSSELGQELATPRPLLARPVPGRPWWRRLPGARIWARPGVVVWVVLFAIWEVVGRLVNPIILAPPSAVAAQAVQFTLSGDLPTAILISSRSLVMGFTLGTLAGIVVGLLMGRSRWVEYSIDTLVSALYAAPTSSYIPLLILWFGLGLQSKVVIVFMGVFFPVLINTYVGARDVSATLMEVGDAFAMNRFQKFYKIVTWATFPYIVGGIRVGIGRGISAMVLAELLTSYEGLGQLIKVLGSKLRPDQLFVPVVALVLLGVGLVQVARYFEGKIAPWKETERAQV